MLGGFLSAQCLVLGFPVSLSTEVSQMKISNRLVKHAAIAASVAAAASANAAIVYSGVINFACAVDIDGTYINVETGQLSNGPGTGVPGWDVNPYSTAGGMNFFNSTGGGQMRRPGVTTGTAGNLALGTVIGAAGSFNSATGNVYGTTSATGLNGGWTYGSENIIGFRFVAASGATHYGWMRFLMGAIGSAGLGNNAPTRTVVDYAYESVASASIEAGAVPAPGALALLGVAGLAGTRRRR
jgi:MYXO-CTERM domain-containing protein